MDSRLLTDYTECTRQETIVRHPRNHGFMVTHVLNGMRQDTLCETPNLKESDGKYLL